MTRVYIFSQIAGRVHVKLSDGEEGEEGEERRSEERTPASCQQRFTSAVKAPLGQFSTGGNETKQRRRTLVTKQ